MNNASKRAKKTRKKKLSQEEIKFRREQRNHKNSIRSILRNIGFERIPDVSDHHFEFRGIKTELDDAFMLDNLLLLVEYTIGDPHTHLKNKSLFYERLNADKNGFINELNNGLIAGLKSAIDTIELAGYSRSEVYVKVVYASKKEVSYDDKNTFSRLGICFFDFSIVQYFSVIAKTIKRSGRFEFLAFLDIDPRKIGPDSLDPEKKGTFSAQILPESRSSMRSGYLVISFYISPDELLKRAFVLRDDSWRSAENANLYQRLLDPGKIKSMRKYLSGTNYVYVNNIIATLDASYVTLYDNEGKRLDVSNNGMGSSVELARIEIQECPNIIVIIDGQHRVFSYHEGDDLEESTIVSLRKRHNLLVTGILFPADTSPQEKRRFEAKLFLEINSKQQAPKSDLKQKIAELLEPLSPISIARKIILKLNQSGPLADVFEKHFYEQDKIKTASIISYGLKPLIKFNGNDSLYSVWDDSDKNRLISGEQYDEVLNRYIEYSSSIIRNAFIALKQALDKERWAVAQGDNQGILSVVLINSILNLIRLCLENGRPCTQESFFQGFSKIEDISFIKEFHSSQYRKLGERLFNDFFMK